MTNEIEQLQKLVDSLYFHEDGECIRWTVEIVANQYENNPERLRRLFNHEDAKVAGIATSAYHLLTGDVRPTQTREYGGLGAIINDSEQGLEFNRHQLHYAELSGNALQKSKNSGHALKYSENKGEALESSENTDFALNNSINSGSSLRSSVNSENALNSSINSGYSLSHSKNLGCGVLWWSENKESSLLGSENKGQALLGSKNYDGALGGSKNEPETFERAKFYGTFKK